MKVYIKSEGKGFFILLPTALFLNRLTAAIAVKSIKSKYPPVEISAEDFMKLTRVVKEYKRKHGRLELVNIITADGEVIYVSL